MKHRLILLLCSTIIALELGLIVFSIGSRYIRSRTIESTQSPVRVVPVRKEFLVSSPSSGLKYFYEPPPSVVQRDKQDWLSYIPEYTINSDTLNERYDYPVDRAPNTYRIITLGDSFTFGHFVNTKDNWTEVLEDLLNEACLTKSTSKIEVINLGERGYDVRYMAHRLATRGMKYAPDLILYFESTSGFDRNRELDDPYIEFWVNRLTELDSTRSYLDIVKEAAEKANVDVRQKYSDIQLFEEIHQAWVEFFAVRKSTPIIVASRNDLNLRDLMRLKLWTIGHKHVSLALSVRNINEFEGGTLLDGHPSVLGHKMIADDILRYLKDKEVVSCK